LLVLVESRAEKTVRTSLKHLATKTHTAALLDRPFRMGNVVR